MSFADGEKTKKKTKNFLTNARKTGSSSQKALCHFFSHKFPAQHNLISNFSPVHRDA
jgi:hypothetical protein